MDIVAAIGIMVGGAVVNGLAFTGGNYLFSLVGDKSAEAEKERKRHDLAIEELQRAQVKYQHKRQLRLDYLNQQLQAEQHSAQVFEDVDVAMREYWLVTGGNESKLKAVPEDGKAQELSDYYSPSEAKNNMNLHL